MISPTESKGKRMNIGLILLGETITYVGHRHGWLRRLIKRIFG